MKDYIQIDLFSEENPEYQENKPEDEIEPKPVIDDKYKNIPIW